MPTLKPRFQVTETPDIRRALDVAARAWPGASRSELVLRLFLRGAEAVEADSGQRASRRRQAVDASAGSLDVAYETGYLEALRTEWPE